MVIAVKLHSNGWYSDSHSKWELRGKGLIKSGFQRIWFAMCKDRSNDTVKTSDTHTDETSFPELQLEVHCAAEEGMRAKGQNEGGNG